MSKAKIFYHDIGDYLDRDEKLNLVKTYGSFAHLPLTELSPNEHGDWISMRNEGFDNYIPLAPEKKFDTATKTFFNTNAVGINTARDAWVYNFSPSSVAINMGKTILFYNEILKQYVNARKDNPNADIEKYIDNDYNKISWSVNLKRDFEKLKGQKFSLLEIKQALYRPFQKQNLYYNHSYIERPSIFNQLLPLHNLINKFIVVTGASASKDFSVLLSNSLTSFDTVEKAQCFPLYYYEENKSAQPDFFNDENEQEYTKRDAVSDYILNKAQTQYNAKNISKEDIFYYVYGFLHSQTYRETFANDLKKMLPRLPLVDDVKDFWAFSNAGRQLANLHLNYETVPAYAEVTVKGDEGKNYLVEKMRFPKKGQQETIIYNSQITLENIPAQAYEYVVNGKSAIEWIMERYQITTHKESGIKNNPNDWATEVDNPRYILDLLLSIINVSIQTVDIVNGLPKLEF